MFELIIFLVSSWITFQITAYLIIKLNGKELGCLATIFTIFVSIAISLGVAQRLNPNKADSFFFRGNVDKAVEKYKENYKSSEINSFEEYDNGDVQHQYAKKNKLTIIGALCRDGTIVSSSESDCCSNNDGLYEWIYKENASHKTIPKSTFYAKPELSNSGGAVKVKGYYRKDGTYVRPHTRSAPRK